MPKTRVVLLIPTLDRSGAEKQFTLLATRLPRDEFDVRAIALTRGGPYEADLRAAGVPLTVIGKRAKFDPSSFWRLRNELKRHDPDILHTWLFAANAYGRLCAHAIPRAKIVVSERCVDRWKSGWQLWLDRRLIARTDRLVGNSPSVVEFYRELGVPAEKLVCIPNGIECDPPSPVPSPRSSGETVKVRVPSDDVALHLKKASSSVTPHSPIDRRLPVSESPPHPNPLPPKAGGEGTGEEPLTPSPQGRDEGTASKNREALLAELHLPSDAFVAGYIGRLAKQKRVEDLIWAVETLRQIRPQLHLVVIGEGPERERLEQFTRDVHCTEHVRFLGHRDDAARLLPGFDVLCLASSFEGMSNSVMEAMAAGLPVLASAIPPNRELVVPAETGFLFQPADTVGIMQFLRRLIDEPGLGERLGQAGRDRIRREFGIERMVDAYADLYRHVMGR